MHHYCLTLRKTVPIKYSVANIKKLCLSYLSYLEYQKKRNPSCEIEYYFESVMCKNKKHNLHLHAMMRSPDKISFVTQQKGWSILFEPVRNIKAWSRYIQKDRIKTISDVLFCISQQIEVDQLIAESPLECRSYVDRNKFDIRKIVS